MLNLWCAAALLGFVADNRCDHMWAVNVEGKFQVASYVDCKSGEVFNLSLPFFGSGSQGQLGVQGNATCPTVVVYTPAHGEPAPKPYWRLKGPTTLKETVYTYGCKRDWFLLFPISQPYCQYISTREGGNVQSFGCETCPSLTDMVPVIHT